MTKDNLSKITALSVTFGVGALLFPLFSSKHQESAASSGVGGVPELLGPLVANALKQNTVEKEAVPKFTPVYPALPPGNDYRITIEDVNRSLIDGNAIKVISNGHELKGWLLDNVTGNMPFIVIPKEHFVVSTRYQIVVLFQYKQVLSASFLVEPPGQALSPSPALSGVSSPDVEQKSKPDLSRQAAVYRSQKRVRSSGRHSTLSISAKPRP